MEEIDAAIADLGGCVAPKLTWSSPHDAAWVTAGKSVACANAQEVRRPCAACPHRMQRCAGLHPLNTMSLDQRMDARWAALGMA